MKYFKNVQVGEQFLWATTIYDLAGHVFERIANRLTVGPSGIGTVNCIQLDTGRLQGMGPDVVVQG